jgi:Protein of unknown function (DUF4232)
MCRIITAVLRCPVFGLVVATTSYAAATMLASPAWAVPFEAGDEVTPCRSDQIAIGVSPTDGAVGRRAVTLVFTLAGGATACSLSGYPAVDTGAGDPPLHAEPTLRGYLGGVPAAVDAPPTVTLSLTQQAQAIVEGLAVDGRGNHCPTYTELLVNPPGTVFVTAVPVTIDACSLQVHPVTPG